MAPWVPSRGPLLYFWLPGRNDDFSAVERRMLLRWPGCTRRYFAAALPNSEEENDESVVSRPVICGQYVLADGQRRLW